MLFKGFYCLIRVIYRVSSVYALMAVLYNCSDSLRGFQCVLLIMVIKRVALSEDVFI